jgi:serine/threonine protein kinase
LQEETDSQTYPEIPGYKILSELGRGGIATVYLAVQESLDRQVALKVMSPLLAMEPDYAERFIREGRTVAQLSHSNIITVYDIGLEKHQLFIAMEYISGGNMRTIMLEHQDDPEWALSIAGQIALALGYAHTVGIVHRDVKPENILFRENGSAVLTDFGIAKTIASNTNLTRAGTIIGTPKYMSPEQTDGLGNDPRTDVYSLGIILFEMLTGNVPYDSENSMAVLYAHVHAPIPELPEKLSDLQPLLNNLLAKKAEDRADDCDELAEIIRITRRERHYALKDPDRMQDANLDDEIQQTAKARNKPNAVKKNQTNKISQFFNTLQKQLFAEGGKDKSRKNIKYLAVTLLGAISLILLISIFSNDSEELNTATETSQQQDNSSPVAKQTKDEQDKNTQQQSILLTSPVASSALEDKDPVSAELDDSKSTSSNETANSIDTITSEKNQTKRLVSRFLADESHDELVKQHQAPAPVSKKEKKKPVVLSKKQKKINQLLISARDAIKEGHITKPANSNAVSYYKQVLELSPGNRRALRGLDVSGDIIHEEAREKYKAGKKDFALTQIDKALKLIPDHKNLLALKVSIEASFNPNSSFATAEKLYYGVDGARNKSRAAFYYKKAADLGHIQAMNNIGVAYADGDGIQQNERLAMKWLEESARLKNSEAMYNLALGYHFSSISNPPKALPWVRQSAEAEYRPAYMLIGWMTTTGAGMRASRVGSIRWDLKGMINPISNSLHSQYRIPKKWQSKFMVKYKAATNTGN